MERANSPLSGRSSTKFAGRNEARATNYSYGQITNWSMRKKVGFGSMLSKKSFGGNKRNFLKLLMRFARSDVRDHIVSQKNDHGPSYRHYRASQRRGSPKITICEIFGVVRFSDFSTASVTSDKTHIEQNASVLTLIADMPRDTDFHCNGPEAVIRRVGLGQALNGNHL